MGGGASTGGGSAGLAKARAGIGRDRLGRRRSLRHHRIGRRQFRWRVAESPAAATSVAVRSMVGAGRLRSRGPGGPPGRPLLFISFPWTIRSDRAP